MSKKLIAIAMALLMALSIVSVIQPAKAATPDGISVFLRPGVEDPFHPGWSQTLGTLWNHQDEVINNYLDYAILASTDSAASIGDLQFDITIENSFHGGLIIYMPPGFEFMTPGGTVVTSNAERRFNIWTDITNDYNFIGASKRNAWDTVCAGCIRILVGFSGIQPDDDPAWYDGTTWDPGTYHVRLLHVRAPMEAGVYQFKIGMGPWNPFSGSNAFSVADWPIMIVKSELNPAYITGKVALCATPHAAETREACTTFDTSRYGKVWVEGTTPEGRSVSARYYISPADVNDGIMYDYILFGVAAGTYTLMASAGGYPQSSGQRITVMMGQSAHLQPLYLVYGPQIDVTVWSKHGRGAIPWASLWQPPYGTNDPTVLDLDRPRPIRLDLYDADGNWVTGVCGNPSGTPPFAAAGCAFYPRPPLNDPAFIGGSYAATDPLSDHYTVTLGPDIMPNPNAPARVMQFINGFVDATYSIGAYVTGYVMTEDDAWQRTFVPSGGLTHIELDLRRSNWFEIKPSMGFDPPFPTVPSTLVLTATDANGVERGANSLFLAGTEVSLDSSNPGDLLFWDAPAYGDGFVCQTCGFGPQVNPNSGANYNLGTDPVILEGYSYRYLYTQFDTNDESATEPGWRDYGFQPGTYDIDMHMADLGDPSGRFFGLGAIEGVGWYTIREGYSTKGSIALCNSPSTLTFNTRSNSLTVTLRSVDWQTPAHIKPWSFPGAEIQFQLWLGEGTTPVTPRHEGDEEVQAPDTGLYGIVQDDGTIGSPYVLVDDPATLEVENPACLVPVDLDGDGFVDVDLSACLKIKYTGNDYGLWWTFGPDAGLAYGYIGAYPTSLPPGMYDYDMHTYGYVPRGTRSLYGSHLTLGGDADIQVDLIQGGQIRVISTFYKTTYVDSVAFNGWMRVEVFDSNDKLVAANVYGQADPNPLAVQAGLLAYAPYDPTLDYKKIAGEPAEGAGNDAYPELGYGQRAYFSQYFYGNPSTTFANYYNTDPIDAHRLAVPAFEDTASDVYGWYNYFGDKSSRNDGLWANGWETTNGNKQYDHGLAGSKDIAGVTGGGLYKVKVWAFDPMGPDGVFGTADDWQSYYQFEEFNNVEVPWGGVVSVHPSMLQYGRIVGDMRWMDQYGNSLPMPWLQVTASGSEGTFVTYSTPFDSPLLCGDPVLCETSVYMWLPDGTYDMSAEVTVAPAVLSAPAAPPSIQVTHGFSAGADFDMQQTGVPVPEFGVAPLVALSALAASLYVLKRRRK